MALKDVLIDELRDMYSAEDQLVKALPKLAKGAKNGELKMLLTAHLEEAKGPKSAKEKTSERKSTEDEKKAAPDLRRKSA